MIASGVYDKHMALTNHGHPVAMMVVLELKSQAVALKSSVLEGIINSSSIISCVGYTGRKVSKGFGNDKQ